MYEDRKVSVIIPAYNEEETIAHVVRDFLENGDYVDEVVNELSQTGATLFGGAAERAALNEALRTHESSKKKNDK